MVTEQFPYFAGMTGKWLPSFGDEILTLLFNHAFNLLNDFLFICVFALDYVCGFLFYSKSGREFPVRLNHALIYHIHTMGFSFP